MSSSVTSMHESAKRRSEEKIGNENLIINKDFIELSNDKTSQKSEDGNERSGDEKVVTRKSSIQQQQQKREMTEFEKLLKMEDDDDEDDDEDEEVVKKKLVVEEKAQSMIDSAHDFDDDEEAVIDLFGSDQFATVFVGTSKQSHNEPSTALDDVLEDGYNIKRERLRRMTVDTELQTTINRAIAEEDEFAAESSEYLDMHGEDDDDVGTLTLVEEDDVDGFEKSELEAKFAELHATSELLGDDQDESVVAKKEGSSEALAATSSHHRLKRTVMTILLTHKWQKVYPGRRAKKRAAKKMMRFEPTYRMEPKVSLDSVMYLVVSKARHTFESLVEKHGKYDVEYTPRFLRIITEMIKNDVKSFRLDRYKIVVTVLILKKVLHQSAQYMSRMLADQENDERICLTMNTKSFYAVCLIFLIYHE